MTAVTPGPRTRRRPTSLAWGLWTLTILGVVVLVWLDQLLRLDLELTRERLALHVEPIDLGRQREGLLVALGHEQPIGQIRIVEPTGRVHPRRDSEPECGCVDFAWLEA